MSTTDFFDQDLVRRRERAVQAGASIGGEPAADTAVPRNELSGHPVADLNLTRMAKHRETVNVQVAGAMKEIEQLRRRQEDLERERQNLEEMGRKQDQYERGKREMIDSLEQSLALLQKKEVQCVRLTEIYAGTQVRFQELLQSLQAINDGAWPEESIREELNRALVQIEEARKEYGKSIAKIEAAGGGADAAADAASPLFEPPAASGQPQSFGYWLKVGFAVTLPLMILIAVLAIILAARG